MTRNQHQGGNILISVHALDGDVVDRVKAIMKEAGAEDITSTGEVSLSDDKHMPRSGKAL